MTTLEPFDDKLRRLRQKNATFTDRDLIDLMHRDEYGIANNLRHYIFDRILSTRSDWDYKDLMKHARHHHDWYCFYRIETIIVSPKDPYCTYPDPAESIWPDVSYDKDTYDWLWKWYASNLLTSLTRTIHRYPKQCWLEIWHGQFVHSWVELVSACYGNYLIQYHLDTLPADITSLLNKHPKCVAIMCPLTGNLIEKSIVRLHQWFLKLQSRIKIFLYTDIEEVVGLFPCGYRIRTYTIHEQCDLSMIDSLLFLTSN